MSDITNPEVREDRYGDWSARCTVDGETWYVTGSDGHYWLSPPPTAPATFKSRRLARRGLRKAVRYVRDGERRAAERAVREARLASHPNGGWDPA